MNNLKCPDEKNLTELLLGRVLGEDGDRLRQHLESCDRCGQLAETIHAEDDLTAAITRPAPAVEVADELIDQMKKQIS